MNLKHLILPLVLASSDAALAETAETERLAAINGDYAKCADSAIGNFPTDKDSQQVTKVFYQAMLANNEKMIELELEAKSELVELMVDIMGERALAGYFLNAMSKGDQAYKNRKQELKELFSYDWREVNKSLWHENGCNAIYANMKP